MTTRLEEDPKCSDKINSDVTVYGLVMKLNTTISFLFRYRLEDTVRTVRRACTYRSTFSFKTSIHRHISSVNRNMDKVHVVAKDGFKEGKHYDLNRPSYTDEITAQVVKNLYRGSNASVKYNILEVGAGTGKFTRKLQPHLGKDQSYLASDPSEEFLAVLKEQSPDLETQIFSAFKIPLPDQCVQNIVCAQCFHWCANKECLDEMTRVLVPQGRILCVWNHKNWEVDWVKETEDIMTTYYHMETPRAYLKQWQTAIEEYDGVRCAEHLKLPGIQNMEGDKDFIVDHFASISVIALLEDEEQKVARAKFRAVLDKFFPEDQKIHIPFFSEFYCAEKI